MNDENTAGWILASISTAGAPASLRVTVWRRLKELGALYLQQSVCLLPSRAATDRAVARLAERIIQDGGTVRILHTSFPDPKEEAGLIEELSNARNAEYSEVLERFPSFFAELEAETARGRATFEEVEESEADLARFRTWLRKIAARDYFQAEMGAQARAELKRAEEALAAFSELAMAAEIPRESEQAE